jgi:hypothetical protein
MMDSLSYQADAVTEIYYLPCLCLTWAPVQVVHISVPQADKQIRKAFKDETLIFACCFYGCETWSMTGEERRLRLENRLLMRIFRHKGMR